MLEQEYVSNNLIYGQKEFWRTIKEISQKRIEFQKRYPQLCKYLDETQLNPAGTLGSLIVYQKKMNKKLELIKQSNPEAYELLNSSNELKNFRAYVC